MDIGHLNVQCPSRWTFIWCKPKKDKVRMSNVQPDGHSLGVSPKRQSPNVQCPTRWILDIRMSNVQCPSRWTFTWYKLKKTKCECPMSIQMDIRWTFTWNKNKKQSPNVQCPIS